MQNIEKKGFTLVELLVVIAIIAIVSGAVTANFLAGMKLWQRAKEQDEAYSTTLLTLEYLIRDLRNYRPLPQWFLTGDTEQITFPAVNVEGLAAFTYRFAAYEQKLIRERLAYEKIISGEEEFAPEREWDMPAETFSFSYLVQDRKQKETAWMESVEDDKSTVLAVKIKVRAGGQDIEKTIFLSR